MAYALLEIASVAPAFSVAAVRSVRSVPGIKTRYDNVEVVMAHLA